LKRYSEEEKQEYIRLYHGGQAATSLCKEYGFSRSSLFGWIQQYKCLPPKAYSSRQIYLLEQELARLRTENQIFRKSKCSVSSSLEDKLIAIEELSNEFSVHALCNILRVRRSTYYHHLNRSPDQTMIEKDDAIFKPLIREIFEQSKYRFGAKKIRVKLKELGYNVGDKRILRLMKELELTCVFPKPKRCFHNPTGSNRYRNKLNLQFEQPAPNKVWVSDVTYVRVSNGFYYICVVIDLYARKVLSYGISKDFNVELVMDTFSRAYDAREQPSKLMFHSDQGVQYTSYIFRELLRNKKVDQSFSKPGAPYDNAIAEAFFASMKKEELFRNIYDSADDLIVSVCEYVDFFNNNRPHQRLGFKTPNQAEEAFWAKNAAGFEAVQV
jgi:transposase InsO family protein/transposase-like protein